LSGFHFSIKSDLTFNERIFIIYRLKMYDVHSKEPEEVASFFDSNLEVGLKDEQVAINRKRYGKNQVPSPERVSFPLMVCEQFKDPAVLILLGAVILGFSFAFLEAQ